MNLKFDKTRQSQYCLSHPRKINNPTSNLVIAFWFCAAPLGVWYRLRSPSISHFTPFIGQFKHYLTSYFGMELYQLDVANFTWVTGPKLILFLKLFPPNRNTSNKFSADEMINLTTKFYTLDLPLDNFFGPYDLINFAFTGPYENGMSLEFYSFFLF